MHGWLYFPGILLAIVDLGTGEWYRGNTYANKGSRNVCFCTWEERLQQCRAIQDLTTRLQMPPNAGHKGSDMAQGCHTVRQRPLCNLWTLQLILRTSSVSSSLCDQVRSHEAIIGPLSRGIFRSIFPSSGEITRGDASGKCRCYIFSNGCCLRQTALLPQSLEACQYAREMNRGTMLVCYIILRMAKSYNTSVTDSQSSRCLHFVATDRDDTSK